MVTSLVPRNHDLCPKTAWPGGSWYMILLRVICFPVSFLLAVNPLLGTISWMCSQTKNTQQRIRSSPGLQVLFDTHTHKTKRNRMTLYRVDFFPLPNGDTLTVQVSHSPGLPRLVLTQRFFNSESRSPAGLNDVPSKHQSLEVWSCRNAWLGRLGLTQTHPTVQGPRRRSFPNGLGELGGGFGFNVQPFLGPWDD